jgi:hypothetical protein
VSVWSRLDVGQYRTPLYNETSSAGVALLTQAVGEQKEEVKCLAGSPGYVFFLLNTFIAFLI